jgi:hypothetical protein
MAVIWGTSGAPFVSTTYPITDGTHTYTVAREELAYFVAPTSNVWYMAFRIPDDMVPGTYTLTASGKTWTFVVEAAATARPLVTIAAGSPAADVTTALAAGNNVQLGPGLHEWTEPVVVPLASQTIIGFGAVVRGGGPAGFGPIGMILLQNKDFTLLGGTYYPVDNTWVIISELTPAGPDTYPDAALNYAVKDVTVIDGGTAAVWRAKDVGAYHINVTGERARGSDKDGLYWNCYWRGYAQGDDTFRIPLPKFGNVGVIACTFDGTGRGLVFQTNSGDIVDNIAIGVRFVNISYQTNGCECVLAEGTGNFDRNIFLELRATGCRGPLPAIDSPAQDNFFAGMCSDSPVGAILRGQFGPQSNNEFRACDWSGPLIVGGGGYPCTGNRFYNCIWKFSGPSHGNQTFEDAGIEGVVCCTAVDPGNTITYSCWNLYPGLLPQTGFSVPVNSSDPARLYSKVNGLNYVA